MAGNNRFRNLTGIQHRVGLGGEGVLRTEGRSREALAMLTAAYEAGIRYYDSAPAYAGSERYYGLFWAQHPREEGPHVPDQQIRTAKCIQGIG